MAAFTNPSPRHCPSCWNFPTARTSARWALLGLGVSAFIIAMLVL